MQSPTHYRQREEYQLARALLADVCAATAQRIRQLPRCPESGRLRRSAIALPKAFLPNAPSLTDQEERDSQRLMLEDLALALSAALDSGALDEETAQRIEQRRAEIVQRLI